jgi:hypothetical protein
LGSAERKTLAALVRTGAHKGRSLRKNLLIKYIQNASQTQQNIKSKESLSLREYLNIRKKNFKFNLNNSRNIKKALNNGEYNPNNKCKVLRILTLDDANLYNIINKFNGNTTKLLEYIKNKNLNTVKEKIKAWCVTAEQRNKVLKAINAYTFFLNTTKANENKAAKRATGELGFLTSENFINFISKKPINKSWNEYIKKVNCNKMNKKFINKLSNNNAKTAFKVHCMSENVMPNPVGSENYTNEFKNIMTLGGVKNKYNQLKNSAFNLQSLQRARNARILNIKKPLTLAEKKKLLEEAHAKNEYNAKRAKNKAAYEATLPPNLTRAEKKKLLEKAHQNNANAIELTGPNMNGTTSTLIPVPKKGQTPRQKK